MFLYVFFFRIECRKLPVSDLFHMITLLFLIVSVSAAPMAAQASDEKIMETDDGELLDDGVYRYDPDKQIHIMLRQIREDLAGELTPRERARLLYSAAQLEAALGNFHQAVADIEASFETGVLTDSEKTENYFFLGRVFLAVKPPKIEKAVENMQKYIKTAEIPNPDAFFFSRMHWRNKRIVGNQSLMLKEQLS